MHSYRTIFLCVTLTLIITLQVAFIPRERRYSYASFEWEGTRDWMFADVNNSQSAYFPKQKDVEKRWLTIGIPTIERQNGSYLFTMLESLLNETDADDLNNMYLVIFLADFDKDEWKNKTEERLKQKYSTLFENGTLKVIRAPRAFYSTYDSQPKRTARWHWVTKQNYDYAFMLMYCHLMSEFYMQMEDDVITKKGYMNSIRDFLKENDNWVCLEFSELGFIGKLYRSSHLFQLAQFLLIFDSEHPVDVNMYLFHEVKGQNQNIRLFRKPTLFQHIGYHSSLPGKIQPLKDQFYNATELII